jgi:ATP-dependent Clp protease ATP-binding subunit ClpC
MWQRFTERARRVVLLGLQEGEKMGSEHVGTEHLLLGLVSENEGVAAKVLQKMGVSLQKVRQEIAAEAEPGTERIVTEPKLTLEAKRVLELAADEARNFNHNYVGAEHLLLGLLREEGQAAKVLLKMGLDLEAARNQVMEYLGPETKSDAEA